MRLVVAALAAIAVAAPPPAPSAHQGDQGAPRGFTRILVQRQGRWVLDGWRHFGPGSFTLDSTTGVLETHGGMGLLWYASREYQNFQLQLDFKSADAASNSGVFLRVPTEPVSDDYIAHAWEIQINDAGAGVHTTGAVEGAVAPSRKAVRRPGQWNRYLITFRQSHITVVLNGRTVVDWEAEPRGEVLDFSGTGFIGLQNHEGGGPVWFRDIFVRELPEK